MRGKGNIHGGFYFVWWDHPRLCGEKSGCVSDISRSLGSPPPMRGKVIFLFLEKNMLRITPAYAGKSTDSYTYKCRYEDHPRLCGEKPRRNFVSLHCIGSPPPMRGKVTDFANACKFEGITPAYAGKSDCHAALHGGKRDHPRLCGEKGYGVANGRMLIGSPPPMRGKGLNPVRVPHTHRITPAYAGKSRFSYEIRSTS